MSITVQDIDDFIECLEEMRSGDLSQIKGIELIVNMVDTHSPTPVGASADTCPDCGGRGVIAYQGQGEYECSKCEGIGQV